MEPKCIYFGKCGGCTNQHVPYELQLKNKKERVAKLLGMEVESVNAFSDSDYEYRNRMDFVFHSKGLGLREKGKWYSIVDIERCEISNLKLNALLKEVRAEFKGADAFDIVKKTGTFRYAVIRATEKDSSITFILNDDSKGKEDALEKIKEYAKKATANSIIVGFVPKDTDVSITRNIITVKGKEFITENILGRDFSFHTQGFFQNNTRMAEKIVAYVKDIMKERKGNLLDMYGGVGLFGISCSDGFESVRIIECDEGSIASAKNNIKNNGIKNSEAIVMDAKSLNKLALKKPLHVITDPPRSGMHPKAIERLMALEPETIIYVSCNPEQLSKELVHLRKKYDVKSAALFDLFPQTNHVETVLELSRK